MRDIDEKRRAVARRLRLAREMAGLSQSQVANLMGLNRPTVSEFEAGRRKVAAEELAKLAGIYAVDPAWVTGSSAAEHGQERDRLELAARELAKLKDDDLDRLLQLLRALKPARGKPG